jgi:hypothetical protein
MAKRIASLRLQPDRFIQIEIILSRSASVLLKNTFLNSQTTFTSVPVTRFRRARHRHTAKAMTLAMTAKAIGSNISISGIYYLRPPLEVISATMIHRNVGSCLFALRCAFTDGLPLGADLVPARAVGNQKADVWQ